MVRWELSRKISGGGSQIKVGRSSSNGIIYIIVGDGGGTTGRIDVRLGLGRGVRGQGGGRRVTVCIGLHYHQRKGNLT